MLRVWSGILTDAKSPCLAFLTCRRRSIVSVILNRRVPYRGHCCTFCTPLSLVDLHIHQYANDSQVYTSTSVSEARIAVHSFADCDHDVNEWMRASRLRLSPTKTQVMWLGSGQQLKHVDINDIPLLSTTVQVVDSARDLGAVFDSRLTLSAHVAALCRSGYYQLRQLRLLVQSMNVEDAAFISCRLDYFNSLLYGLLDILLRKLQSVQNATVRLITGTRRSDHISPVLHELHWLLYFCLQCFDAVG